MSARVAWYQEGSIILFEVSDPLLLEEIKGASEEVWALAKEVREPVDMIFDYRHVTHFPRGILPVVRDGHFTLPTLERVALVGYEALIEMMFVTLTRATYRPDPTIHATVEEAAETLRQIAEDDRNR